MARWDGLLGVGERFGELSLRKDQVYRIGTALTMLIDPIEFGGEFLHRECTCSQHSHPPDGRHSSDDVSAVAEREDRELDSELIGDLHRASLPRIARAIERSTEPLVVCYDRRVWRRYEQTF